MTVGRFKYMWGSLENNSELKKKGGIKEAGFGWQEEVREKT